MTDAALHATRAYAAAAPLRCAAICATKRSRDIVHETAKRYGGGTA